MDTTIKSNSNTYWNRVYSEFHKQAHERNSVWNEEATPFFIRLIEFLRHEGVRTIIDAGCGDGRNIEPFLESGFNVIGIDSSDEALSICRKHFGDNPELVLIRQDITKIELNEQVDAVMCDHVLTHIRDVEKALDSFYRSLKKGGFALIEFTSPLDSTYGTGEKISEREFLQKGVYLRYDSVFDIHEMMKRFEILCFTSEHSTDPRHGPGYIRKERHAHHSYFILARK